MHPRIAVHTKYMLMARTQCVGQHYAAFMRINGFGNLANTKLVQLVKTLGDWLAYTNF